jgi:hypothetical protein
MLPGIEFATPEQWDFVEYYAIPELFRHSRDVNGIRGSFQCKSLLINYFILSLIEFCGK